ncbi:MAG: hypothetical protein LBP54_01760 [Campylobacteraceae bacterium]|jgi:hypothetical protein|nr:hypothetical protein [Campylobacteraceae bacterium]
MIAEIITALVCLLALAMIFYVSSYRRYDLSKWSGVLTKWADDNGVSRKRMPRYDEKTLLKITELDLSYLGLSSLPEEIGNLANLKKLDLQGNNLTALPKNITALKLTHLDLWGNKGLTLSAEQQTWTRGIQEFDPDD